MTDPQPDDRPTEPIWSDRQLLDGLILEIGNILVPDQYRDDFMCRTGGDLSAIDEAFASIDDAGLIEAALAKRLHGQTAIRDDAEFARLYRYLMGQGFEADQIVRALKARSVK